MYKVIQIAMIQPNVQTQYIHKWKSRNKWAEVFFAMWHNSVHQKCHCGVCLPALSGQSWRVDSLCRSKLQVWGAVVLECQCVWKSTQGVEVSASVEVQCWSVEQCPGWKSLICHPRKAPGQEVSWGPNWFYFTALTHSIYTAVECGCDTDRLKDWFNYPA